MNQPSGVEIMLIGKLAGHPRGRTLKASVGAVPGVDTPKGNGIGLLFATEFQDGNGAFQQAIVEWAVQPGRTLLLLPPMQLAECKLPVNWRTINAGTIDSSKNKGLSKLLSAEVKYELITEMQPARSIDGEWSRGGVNTAYFKKHPNSGVFAATALPLWSLTTLDHRQQLIDWLMQLHALAGQPIDQEDLTEPEERVSLTPDHFALMLHLVSGQWKNRQSALRSMQESVVLALVDTRASECMGDLEKDGLANDGRLTDQGKLTLRASPYKAYAASLENS